jgi:hypothetical protein
MTRRVTLSFCLDEAVPDDHRVGEIAAVLDLFWVHGELAPIGRPSIDPVPRPNARGETRPTTRHYTTGVMPPSMLMAVPVT